MAKLEMWVEFASTYSYLSVMRIDALAEAAGVETVWTPFLLGPIFRMNGWDTSPFNIFEAKGRYMWRDVERRAEKHGLSFRRPPEDQRPPFPQNGLHAARMALIGLEARWGRPFCRAVYAAQFVEGRDIGEAALIAALAKEAGASAEEIEAAGGEAVKAQLRGVTERAAEIGIFGAPSFVVGEELYWGDDRLEEAIEAARRLPD